MKVSEKTICELEKEIDNLKLEIHALKTTNQNQKKEQEEIKQQLKLSNFVFEAAIAATSTSDIDGILNSINPSFLKTWGYTSKDEVLGRSIATFFKNPQEAIPIIAALNNEGIWEGDFEALKKDGTIFIAHGLATVLKDDNNKIIGYQSSVLDETAQINSEKKLLENQQKLNTLFSAMTEMVVLHEVVFNENHEYINYRIIDCNDAFTHITGIKKEDAIGKLATEIYQQETPPYLDEFCKVATTGENFEFNTYYPPMDKHFMISVVSPSKNTFATITTDITSIQQVQKTITDKNKELENYLYIASHDLRTPLVNIQGFSQRLQKQTDQIKLLLNEGSIENETSEQITKIIDQNIPKTLEYIFSNVIKMDTLINGLLQISRTGRIRMTIRKIDMNNLFKTIITNHNFQITEYSAQVTIDNLKDCYGDENQLNQMFSNIIGNALKYRNKNKQLKIEISSFENFNRIIYQIKDNGIGIPSKFIDKIWDVFYRINAEAGETGEGLGLSLAKRIVDKHKGKISVQSDEDNGSIFYIELPKNTFTE